jgi:hemerythrin-like domain-containing protein
MRDDTRDRERHRRDLLRAGAAGAAGMLLFRAADLAAGQAGSGKRKKEQDEEEVAPAEDLMREHGVLNRVLLIYDEGIRRLETPAHDAPPDVIVSAAGVIRRFIEDYHEKLEENHLFPRFDKANTLKDLVATLRAQHQAGRRVTDTIARLATAAGIKDDAQRRALVEAMRQFNRMYRPHEAREDTVLFPAFRKIVSPHEYAALGEDFEKQEHALFGEDGFESMVDKVAGLEKRLGIYELGQFTPR